MPIDAVILQADAPDRWEKALYAFLAEKERRSGSLRTVQSYSRMLRYFFGRLAKPPDEVRPADVLAYAHGVGLSGKEPSAITIGAASTRSRRSTGRRACGSGSRVAGATS